MTLAAVHGSNSYFALDNAADSLTDLSEYTQRVSGLPGTADTHDITTFGHAWRIRHAGLKDSAFQVEFVYDETLIGILDAAHGATKTYSWGPSGDGSGKPRYTGECFLAGYEVNDPVDDVARVTASFEGASDQTRDTFP